MAALDGYVGALLLEDSSLRRAAVAAISRWNSDVPTAARHVLPLLKQKEHGPAPGGVLLLFFGGLAAAARDVPLCGSLFTLEGAHNNRHHPLFFLREKRCVTCVTGGRKRHLTCHYDGDADAKVCVIPRHLRHP
ncbi:hypothetical protein [Streptomyces sp. LMG1-1-1.1]|uniref:hypothetical protein n=1 Tax=Streptomyces sp. LMG1-1-1.1 TaxID=3135245 RepID=UPI003465E67D